ncbi:hypothetical protein, partial [Limnobacter sp.]|uniref:hypothetical protein n=1 Tax=Limnobacter sp. TaxID=2003368 RepID=UPI00311D98A6
MSRILRRPMFRGGKVDSRGTGITSGLDRPGYATGKGPGFSNLTFSNMNNPAEPTVVTGRQLLDQAMRSNIDIGKLNPYSKFLMTKDSPYYDLGKAAAFDVEQYPPVTSKESNISSSLTDFYTMQDKTGSEIPNNLIVSKDMTTIPGTNKKNVYYDEYDTKPKKTGETSDQSVKQNLEGTKKIKTEFDENEDSDSITISDAEKAKKEYAELLGLEKARMQDAYDMLIRFGGAKGTNFREVAQDFLASEAKAGPSRTEKIKEAAGTLAIKEAIENKQLDKKLAAEIAKGGTQTDMTRAISILNNPKSSAGELMAAFNKIGLKSTLSETLANARSSGAQLSSNAVENFIKVFRKATYKGRLVSGAKDGTYFSPQNKTLYTFDANGQQIDAEVLNY